MSLHSYLPVEAVGRRSGGLQTLVPFRHRRLGDALLLTNDLGDHVFVDDAEFARIGAGGLSADDALYVRLREANFVAAALDRDALVARTREKLRFTRAGPNLHIFVVTLRCNHTCQYCHASRARMDAVETDMDVATAERSVDLAFCSTSPGLTLEFQGGEPLANWPVVQHIIEYARQKNALAGKSLMFALVTNLSLMDDDKLAYLIDRRVQICTSLDGPPDLHDAVRVWRDGASHATTLGWIERIHARYQQAGLDPMLYRVEALPTVTRQSLARGPEIIDHYIGIGCRSIFLRHLDPFGWGAAAQRRLGYSMDEFLAFYRQTFDHIVARNREGTDFVERNAAMLFGKILAHQEPNFLDLRSPCGAGIGQIAYNHDGRLFTCDEGRMVDRGGDACFQIGHVSTSSYAELIQGPVVRSMAMASLLDGQPGCATCAYRPWCGVCPVHNYCEQGSIQGRMADSSWCRKFMGLFDFLMERYHRGDAFERALFHRWATPRAQPHYLHEREAL